MQTILVPLDGSELAEAILPQVETLAKLPHRIASGPAHLNLAFYNAQFEGQHRVSAAKFARHT